MRVEELVEVEEVELRGADIVNVEVFEWSIEWWIVIG